MCRRHIPPKATSYPARSGDKYAWIECDTPEAVYSDFLESASKLVLSAYTRDEIVLRGDGQHLIGLIHRMRLFAPQDVVVGAEAVLKAIVEISLKPSSELRQLAMEALSKSPDPIRS